MAVLVLATHNQGKLQEIQDLLADLDMDIRLASEFGCEAPEETGTSFAENAAIKARFVSQATGFQALADDSGLAVEALNGAPGVYSADWGGEQRDWNMAMQRVYDELQSCQAPAPWTAKFHCVLALSNYKSDTVCIFNGSCPGQIIWPPRGEGGFGYDPIFQPDGYAQTFAENPAFKKQLSHRAAALKEFRDYVASHGL